MTVRSHRADDVVDEVGVWLAGETVDVSVADGLVSIHHRGVLVATHVQRHRPGAASVGSCEPSGYPNSSLELSTPPVVMARGVGRRWEMPA